MLNARGGWCWPSTPPSYSPSSLWIRSSQSAIQTHDASVLRPSPLAPLTTNGFTSFAASIRFSRADVLEANELVLGELDTELVLEAEHEVHVRQ